MSESTTVQITVENWERLNARKRHGDTFNDVVERLLDDASDKRPAQPS